MKRWMVWAALVSSLVALVVARPSLANAQGLPLLREQGGFTVSARMDGSALKLRVLNNGALYSGIVHAYFVREDFAFLYFEYPGETERGQYTLELPPMESGVYDLILEITGGGGHEHDNPRFVQVFDLNVAGRAETGALDAVRRLGLQDAKTDIKPATQRSSFELRVQLDGKPVAWNPYYVHQFVLKTDWSYFKHDHPRDALELSLGAVQSRFTFPNAGEYVVYHFLETGARVDGAKLHPVLRHPQVFNVPSN
jgi:hypothetical protein